MLDATQIKAMEGADKLALFDAFAGQTFPGATVQQIADALGYSRRQVQEWRAKPALIPAIVLLYLQEAANRTDAEGPTRAMQATVDAAEALVERLRDLAQIMKA